MKILIISGFLGAGKTTFLRHLISKTKRDYCVLENEFGEVGVDAGRLAQTGWKPGDTPRKEEIKVWELAEGCICCSMEADFADQVLTISAALDPEILLVEPTGVGKLGNILQNLKRIAYERIEVLSPITIVDANVGLSSMREYPEIAIDQIEYAGYILISKTQNKSEAELQPLIDEIRKHNPDAPIHSTDYLQEPDPWWDELLQLYANLEDQTASNQEQSELESFSLKNPVLPTPEHLILFLDELIRKRYGKIVRAKGALPCGEQMLRFDVVGDQYAIIGADTDEVSAVFIGETIKRDEIRKIFVPARKRATVKKRFETSQ